MPDAARIAPFIASWPGKNPLDSFVQDRNRKEIQALQEQLVSALYKQRHWEEQILFFRLSHLPPLALFNPSTKAKYWLRIWREGSG